MNAVTSPADKACISGPAAMTASKGRFGNGAALPATLGASGAAALTAALGVSGAAALTAALGASGAAALPAALDASGAESPCVAATPPDVNELAATPPEANELAATSPEVGEWAENTAKPNALVADGLSEGSCNMHHARYNKGIVGAVSR